MKQLWNITMGDLLEQTAAKYPDNDCVIYTQWDFRKTYKEFNELVDVVAKGMLALGIKKNDKVAIWANNYPEWLLTMWATAKIGAVMVTVNTSYKVFELEYLLSQSDTTTLIMMDGFKDSDYIDSINKICPTLKTSKPGELEAKRVPFLKNVVFVGENTPDGMFNWNELYKLAETITDEELAVAKSHTTPEDTVNMQYTSGTTGFPKGVMLTHNNVVNNGRFIGDNMHFTSEDRLCIPVPFFHCFGCVLAIMASVTHGTAMVPINYFQPIPVMNAIQQERCTAVHGVPTMYIAMLEHPDFEKYDFSSLRTGVMAGSPCPVAVMRQVVDKMNMSEITICYGLTESSPVSTQTVATDSLELRVSTVGRSMPFTETKIVDPETGLDCPPNVTGEFMSRGYNTMKGYYKMPEATALAITEDGWLHSGDLASCDENGYYKITGRIKDMIIRGGENIYPMEIEEYLYTNPKVSDVQVIGVPSAIYGEEVYAAVILKDGETATEDEMKAFVKEGMARHKVPKYIRFVDSFPTTASGKIQKFKMREQAAIDLNLVDVVG